MTYNTGIYCITDVYPTVLAHCSEIKKLLEEAGLLGNRNEEGLFYNLKHSDCFIVLDESTDTVVGFARVVTDWVNIYYLCDVVIDKSHRGRGLGKKLVEWITMYEVKYSGMDGLVRTEDAHGLFSRFGFEMCRENYMVQPHHKTVPDKPVYL
ncbi:MAG: GNAT family N-acetyltransferase [Lachnospiraceae bacterium]|nr:GNAT family N-acetyltransferase [Lachnospiraceae bacterium]